MSAVIRNDQMMSAEKNKTVDSHCAERNVDDVSVSESGV